MNKAESERLASLFEETGYQSVSDVAQADIIVLNTCVVRQNAEDRAVNKLQNFKPLKKARPDMIIAVTGCWVDSNVDRLKAAFPFVDYFFKAGECPPWVDRAKVVAGFAPNNPSRPLMCPLFRDVIISALIVWCLTAAAERKAVPYLKLSVRSKSWHAAVRKKLPCWDRMWILTDMICRKSRNWPTC